MDEIRALAEPLAGRRVLHLSATAFGGGVAEINYTLVPLMQDAGLEVEWRIIRGADDFFNVTKTIHNALQGNRVDASRRALENYEAINRDNAARLRPALADADFVFIHDPQPAALLRFQAERHGRWIWRCHIDVSRPHRPIWKYLRGFVREYDASVFSLAAFAQPLPHPQYLIHPSIDPVSEKNIPLPAPEVDAVLDRFGLDRARPILLQVSRFDRFKDPLGVIEAYRLVKRQHDCRLVLVGGAESDDPEGVELSADVHEAASHDPDLLVIELKASQRVEVNALQRAATIVLQKSTHEGFGLGVAEAMWKSKPVIGGFAGGITAQIIYGVTGHTVNSVEGAAFRARQLLADPGLRERIGTAAREHVRQHFLLTRHLGDMLALMATLGR